MLFCFANLTTRIFQIINSTKKILTETSLRTRRMNKLDCRMSSRAESHSDVDRSDKKLLQQQENAKDENRNGVAVLSSSSLSVPLSSLVNERTVTFDKLTAEMKEIYRLHKEACKAGQSSYIDPSTGYVVLTQYYHTTRGKCCGNGCRHCPYGHENVPEKYRTKTFNTAFYV